MAKTIKERGFATRFNKQNGRVYTRLLPNVSRAVLRLALKSRVPEGSTILLRLARELYDGLITDGYLHHRINHDREFSRGKRNHINSIEHFWGFAKTKLHRYYGIDRRHFHWFLTEMEFRFNDRHEDLRTQIRHLF